MNTLIVKFFVSRSKTLLRRRRKTVKHLSQSKNAHKLSTEKYSIARGYRELQIKKQLDRKMYPNRHIDELMEDIFYPDIRYQNEKAAELAVKMESLPKQSFEEEFQEVDPLKQEIMKQNLASQLLELYSQKKQEFTLEDVTLLLQYLKKSFQKREKIKQSYERKWQRAMEKMKNNDFQFKSKKCPYIFLDKVDIYKYELWIRFVDDLIQAIEGNSLQTLWVEINYCFLVYDAINSIPAQLYDSIQKKLLAFPSQFIKKLDLDEKTMMIKFLNIRKYVQHTQKFTIKQPDEIEQIDENTQRLGVQLCEQILRDKNCGIQQLITVMNTVKNRYEFLTKTNLTQAVPVILRNLTSLSFQKTLDIFVNYAKSKEMNNSHQFLQLLKFDLFRKVSACQNKKYYFKLLANSKSIKSVIDIRELLEKTFQVIGGRYLGKQALQYYEIYQLTNAFFDNNVADNVLLELITNQFMRNHQKFTLEELAEMSFKVYIMGYKSTIMSQFLFDQFIQKYQDRMKRLSQNAKLLLPLEGEGETFSPKEKSKQQIYLQECLIISLWLLVINCSEKLPVQKIMQLYPLKLYSTHPLPIQLSKNIFFHLEKYKLFKMVQYGKTITSEENHKLNIYYGKDDSSSIAKELLMREAIESKLFNLNYCPSKQIYLKESWSGIDCVSQNEYIKWLSRNSENRNLYFNSSSQASDELVNARRKLREEEQQKIEKVVSGMNAEHSIKYYELL